MIASQAQSLYDGETVTVSTQFKSGGVSSEPCEMTELGMSRFRLGAVCGIIFGGLAVASMISISFPDKTAALLGAFINRFSIGFVVGSVRLAWPGWMTGLVFGVMLSLADAVITKAYAPILGMGAIGGVVIGLIVHKYGK